ncbi:MULTISPECIES: 8-amino-7-oxononanoate synthase [unclassified Tepidimonas]|uniref:8-amino-7-oxononanoate synthase n=1 Tax=unclassified Tepidimonas TaxID=2631705 RepID=UPI00261747D1|nr:8-amino-7-oxononanoate synthase [uncultured Tepidimonas sp.]
MLIEHINRQLLDIDAAALRRRRRVGASPCGPHQQWQGGGSMLAFCSNDYLGLANHPALTAALAEGARLWGAGSGASHLVSGHSQAHAALESTLAQWLEPHIPGARALLFCSGYMANVALMTALGDEQATILSDKLNHASLIDGALLARAKLLRYPHGQLDALERQLRACTTPVKLIVTDAVFSMDGDVADLPALLRLAEQYDAWLVIDDAHGFGVLGAHGHGSLEHFGLCSERLIFMGTLGKAAGVSGAFVAAHPVIVEWLVQRARPYIYTTAMPPALAHALGHSLALIEGPEGVERRGRLNELITQLRTGLAALAERHPGLSLPASFTPIQPLIVGDNARALALEAALQARGIRVPAIRPPTVPVGTARLRLTLSASHTAADVDQLLGALTETLNEEQT